jgi:hypothetical protein
MDRLAWSLMPPTGREDRSSKRMRACALFIKTDSLRDTLTKHSYDGYTPRRRYASNAAPQLLDEDVVVPETLLSMLIAIACLISTPVKAAPVNWLP